MKDKDPRLPSEVSKAILDRGVAVIKPIVSGYVSKERTRRTVAEAWREMIEEAFEEITRVAVNEYLDTVLAATESNLKLLLPGSDEELAQALQDEYDRTKVYIEALKIR